MTGERILIVDDGRENREFIVDYILVPNGYTALTAADGEEGLRMVFEESPDLVLLDLQMPKLTGVQVLEAMRAKQINIPVILMTFYGSEEVAIQVFRLGVRDYIAKPFTVDEMLDAIERALTETRLRREKEALTERVLSANKMLQRRLQELNTLYSIGKSVTALLDIDKLLLRICEAAAYVTSAEECSVMMLRGGQLRYTARKVRNEAYAEPVDEAVKDNLALQVIKTAKPVVLTPAESSYAPNAVLYMPLKVRDRVIGVLGVEHVGGQRSFRDHDVTLLGTLADYAAIAIENANNFHELRQMKDQMGEEIAPAAASEASPSRHKAGLLIAGIRGYDELMGKLPPEEAVETLGEYLNLAEDILVKHGAYLGELSHGIVAAFDLPNRDAIQNIIEYRPPTRDLPAQPQGPGWAQP